MDMDVAVDVAPLSDPRDPDIPHSAHVPVDGRRIRWKVACGWPLVGNGKWQVAPVVSQNGVLRTMECRAINKVPDRRSSGGLPRLSVRPLCTELQPADLNAPLCRMIKCTALV